MEALQQPPQIPSPNPDLPLPLFSGVRGNESWQDELTLNERNAYCEMGKKSHTEVEMPVSVTGVG